MDRRAVGVRASGKIAISISMPIQRPKGRKKEILAEPKLNATCMQLSSGESIEFDALSIAHLRMSANKVKIR